MLRLSAGCVIDSAPWPSAQGARLGHREESGAAARRSSAWRGLSVHALELWLWIEQCIGRLANHCLDSRPVPFKNKQRHLTHGDGSLHAFTPLSFSTCRLPRLRRRAPAAMAQGGASTPSASSRSRAKPIRSSTRSTRTIHAHPELGVQEVRTAAGLAEQMRALGFEVTEHVGRTGVVAVFAQRRRPHGAGAHRASTRCRWQEKTGLPYASQGEGRTAGPRDLRRPQLRPRRAHGELGRHRAHAARARRTNGRARWCSVAQPAEEASGGARACWPTGSTSASRQARCGLRAAHLGLAAYGIASATGRGRSPRRLRRHRDRLQGPRRPRLGAAPVRSTRSCRRPIS